MNTLHDSENLETVQRPASYNEDLEAHIYDLGRQDFQTIWERMHKLTQERNGETDDEIWFVEHNPVFTLGQNGKQEHILCPGDIPVVQTDRGGQVTYHGPGQLVAYFMLDLRRRDLSVRGLVTCLEESIVRLAKRYNIDAHARADAPGVYVDVDKLCSIGLRIKKGCSYHGIALNVDMDLEPFKRINPCGFTNLKMTQLAELGGTSSLADVKPVLLDCLQL